MNFTDELIEAALDEPSPSKRLRTALQDVLTFRRHPARLLERDVRRDVRLDAYIGL